MQIHLFLEMAAEAAPDRIAFGSRKAGVSFGELLGLSRQAAHRFATEAPRTVTFTGLNGLGVPVALFGASIAGCSFSPLNYRLADADLRKLLGRSAPAIALCDEDMALRVAGIDGVRTTHLETFLGECAACVMDRGLPAADNDVAVTLFTSGTTSEPKAAILRHTVLLVANILPIVLLSKSLATILDHGIAALKAPTALGGVVIAMIVFTPEAISSLKAVARNELQRAINLCLGAATSTVGLTVPAVLASMRWMVGRDSPASSASRRCCDCEKPAASTCPST